MDCIAQSDGLLLPLMGGSPFNMARAAARRGAVVSYLNPLSSDTFGQGLRALLEADGVATVGGTSAKPTSLAVVQLNLLGPQPATSTQDKQYSEMLPKLVWLALH